MTCNQHIVKKGRISQPSKLESLYLYILTIVSVFISFFSHCISCKNCCFANGYYTFKQFLFPFFLSFFFFFFFFCLSSWAAPSAYGGSHARGRIRATAGGLHYSHSPNQIWATSATYTTAYSNARSGSLTHWARPGMEPASSWKVVRFVSAEPWWELPFFLINEIVFWVSS